MMCSSGFVVLGGLSASSLPSRKLNVEREVHRRDGCVRVMSTIGGNGGRRLGGEDDRFDGSTREGVMVWWRHRCGGNMEAVRMARWSGVLVHCVLVGSIDAVHLPGVKMHIFPPGTAAASAINSVSLSTGARVVYYAEDLSSSGLREEAMTTKCGGAFGLQFHRVRSFTPIFASAAVPVITERLENGRSVDYIDDEGDLNSVIQRDNRSAKEKFTDFIYNVYLPDGFPESVTNDYLQFTQWRVLQNIASSVMAVISTEALLFGLGLGKTGSAVAAATAWVLKDGLGYLGKVLYGYAAGKQFDSDPKSWRVASDAVEDLGGVLELLTPLFPNNFLLLASIANAMKGVSGMTGTATRHAIYKSLALRDNQGDIATKGESQGVTCKMVGLGLGIGISAIIGQKYTALLGTYAVFALIHLTGNWRSMKCVQFATLNMQRGSMVIDAFLKDQEIPTPYDVSHTERVVMPPWRQVDHGVVLGSTVAEAMPTKKDLDQAKKGFKNRRYLATAKNGSIHVVFREDADSQDVLSAYLMSRRYSTNGHNLMEAESFTKRRASTFFSKLSSAGWKTESSVYLLNVRKNRAQW